MGMEPDLKIYRPYLVSQRLGSQINQTRHFTFKSAERKMDKLTMDMLLSLPANWDKSQSDTRRFTVTISDRRNGYRLALWP